LSKHIGTEIDNAAFHSEGFADDNDLSTGALIPGNKPALIVVDMTLGFASEDSPLGGDFSAEIDANVHLCSFFNTRRWPVFFTSVVYDEPEQARVFRQRLPDLNILQRGSHWTELHPLLRSFQTTPLIEKHGPSGFFNTDLATLLKSKNVDTTVITGLTTSGCVRATVIDALQHNFITLVPFDACGDRNPQAHAANLHDMNAKYASVGSVQSITNALASVST